MTDMAELKRIRIHDFRHSCESLLIDNGVNVTLVAKYLEHTKIEETLNTYSHMFSTALDSVVSVIDSLEDKAIFYFSGLNIFFNIIRQIFHIEMIFFI